MAVPALETARLLLRPLEQADAAVTQRLFPHWEIVRYVPDVPWPYPADGAEGYYRNVALPQMAAGTAWRWSLRLKSAPAEMIGTINLMDGDNNRFFWLGLAWQGQGLMTEACDAVSEFWFATLRRPLLRTNKAIVNTASRRISERGGMRVVAVETRDYPAGPLPTQICELSREEWLATRPKK